MGTLIDRARRWIESIGGDTARVEEVNPLPPSPDGRTLRFEIVVRLPSSLDEPPDESTVREYADELRSRIESIDEPEWEGADELYIQFYAPGRATDAGACGTAHWLSEDGYEKIEARPFFFG